MKPYIGAKIIQAEPMTERTFRSVVKGLTVGDEADRAGYLVVYPDGYKSWSPKAVFEEAYRPVSEGEFKIFVDTGAKQEWSCAER